LNTSFHFDVITFSVKITYILGLLAMIKCSLQGFARLVVGAADRPARKKNRPAERRDYREAVRAKLQAADGQARALAAENDRLLDLRNQLMQGQHRGREAATLAALRLHAAACRTLGRDAHNPSEALCAAGWSSAATREVILRGAVARHHGLASVRGNCPLGAPRPELALA